MLRPAAVVLFFLLLATSVSAQIPSGNVYLGYSYVRENLSVSSQPLAPSFSDSNLNGWNGSFEFKLIPWLGGVADFAGNYGTTQVTPACEAIPSPPCGPFNARENLYTFLFGPRASLPLGKFTPFAHGLFGAGHISANGTAFTGIFSTSDTSFATALGGGLDYRIIKGLAWRLQIDDLHTHFFHVGHNNLRFSTGLVLRF